jgi:hypothetical protein
MAMLFHLLLGLGALSLSTFSFLAFSLLSILVGFYWSVWALRRALVVRHL